MATYQVEIDYYDEHLEEERTYSFLTECDTEEQAYDSWSYGEDIGYDTVSDVRVTLHKESALIEFCNNNAGLPPGKWTNTEETA